MFVYVCTRRVPRCLDAILFFNHPFVSSWTTVPGVLLTLFLAYFLPQSHRLIVNHARATDAMAGLSLRLDLRRAGILSSDVTAPS